MTRKVLPLILAVAVLLGTGQQSHAGWWKRNWWKVAIGVTIVGLPFIAGGSGGSGGVRPRSPEEAAEKAVCEELPPIFDCDNLQP
jgi:hypothetical protein